MQKRIKLRALSLCAVFALSCLAACGSEANSSSSSADSAAVAPAAEAAPGGAGRSAPTPELLDDPPVEKTSSADDVPQNLEKVSAVQVKTIGAVPVYKDRENGGTLATLEAGTILTVRSSSDPLWYSYTLDDSREGYLYAEMVSPVSTDGQTVSGNAADQNIREKLEILRQRFPNGKYWNHMDQDLPFGEETPFNVTDEPCAHEIYGETYCNIYNGKTLELFPQYGYLCQCLGFASLLSDQIFGAEAPAALFYDYDLLRVGDQIRLEEYEHSMVVVEKTDEAVTVAEVNADYEDCLISWERQITRYELEYELSWDLEYITRYPMYQDENGTYQFWDSSEEEILIDDSGD